MNENEKSNGTLLREFAFFRNPVLCEAVGLAPILAVAVSVKTGLLLSVMMCISLLITGALTVVFFRRFSHPVRMLLYFVTGSAVSVTALAVTDKLLPTLSAELGLFLPLTAVSSFTALHCERYATGKRDVPFAKHAAASSCGYTAVTLIISAVREIASYGTLFGAKITSHGTSKGYLMPFFALMLMGFLSAALKAAADKHGQSTDTDNDFMKHSVLKENMPDAEKFAAEMQQKMTAKAERAKLKAEKKADAKRKKAEKKREEEERHRLAENEKKLAKEKAERERIERERLEKERIERERIERERLEKERIERERIEREKIEKERIERERIERERLEKERIEHERIEREKIEKERIERERIERDKIEKERIERERIERERLEKERIERARIARAEIDARNEELRRTEERRREIEKARIEESRTHRMSAEEEKLRLRAQAEKERQTRKMLLQEDRRRRKLGLPPLSEEEIQAAFSHKKHTETPSTGSAKSSMYIMPLSNDEEDEE